MKSHHRILLFGIILCITINLSQNWRTDRVPKIYGDKIPDYKLITSYRNVQDKLVTLHNYFRTKVSPSAANMLSMKWHRGAARTAQRWADSCKFLIHQVPKLRSHEPYGVCGQNIFVSTQKVPWLFALRSWFIERENFTYAGSANIPHDIGHYTQMVWAATHKVGCGFAKCESLGPGRRTFYNYVCDYCPIGNYEGRIGFPYRVGAPCSGCPNSCQSNRKLCTNACYAVDLWSNCYNLKLTFNNWLCNTATPEGNERRRNCRATCGCNGRIYD